MGTAPETPAGVVTTRPAAGGDDGSQLLQPAGGLIVIAQAGALGQPAASNTAIGSR